MSFPDGFDPRRAAVLTIDLQNDFLHPEGAYGRAGLAAAPLAALPARTKPVVEALRARGGAYISAQFTLVPGPGGEPLISPHLRSLRPFLGKGDFAPGSWGHGLVDGLAPADYAIEKVAYSAFYQTRLEYVMRALGIDSLIVGGIVTDGGVASTVRDAHLRGFGIVLLADGCAAIRAEAHDATLVSLGGVATLTTCEEAVRTIGGES